MTRKLFDCVQCGGEVHLVRGPGRVRSYDRGHILPVPDTFPTKMCLSCKEMYLTSDESQALDAQLEPAYRAWQSAYVHGLVDALKARHSVCLRDIERACAVTGTYLSHVIKGRKRASLTLTRLLEAYVRHADEFERNLEDCPPSLEAEVQAMLAAPAPPRKNIQEKKYEPAPVALNKGKRPRERRGSSSKLVPADLSLAA